MNVINQITMKRFLNIAALCVVVALHSSCKKDITLKPLNSVPANDFFHSAKDINTGLAGLYSSFQEEMVGDGNNQDEGYGGRYHYWGEVRSDNFDRSGYPSTSSTELSLNGVTNTNTAADWGGLYRTIGRANICIKYFPQAARTDNNVTPTVLNNALAQAYAMRAECYFYIVRNWGDAPIWTQPYEDITANALKARSPKSKIIDSVIIPDLQLAYNSITKGTTANVWYINEGAICAMLADVYMWKGDYQNVITWTNNVFKAKGATGAAYATAGVPNLEPTATWKNLFLSPTVSPEPIWSINWDYTVNGCACIPVSIQLNNNPIRVDSAFIQKWKPLAKTDTRVLKTIDTLNNTSGTSIGHVDKIYKYYNLPATGFPSATTALYYNVYLPMYRLGDVVLTYAEALAYTGDLPNALKYLNYIHTRAGYTAYPAGTFTTTDAMIDAILQEAQFEEFGEGKRWYDLIRTNHVIQVMDPILKRRQTKYGTPAVGFGDLSKELWPISRNALNGNSLLTQNPGY